MTSIDFKAERAIPGRGLWVLWAIAIVAGGACWGAAWGWTDAARMWRAVLISFMLVVPLTAGMPVWPAIVQLSRGKWAGRLERVAFSGLGFTAPSLLGLGVLWITYKSWAPWYGKSEPAGVWLSGPFMFGRDMFVLALVWVLGWLYLRRRNAGQGKVAGGLFAVWYCVAFTLLGFDLLMAMSAPWASTAFGAYVFITGLYGAVVTWTLLSALHSDVSRQRLHDLGKLIVTFSILSGYLAYAHVFPIWYENMPSETSFFVPRFNYAPWKYVSFTLLGLYLGPLVLLLSIWAKRSRWFLSSVCVLMLALMWVDRWWLVAPTFGPGLQLGLPEAGAAMVFLGTAAASMDVFGRLVRVRVQKESGE